MKKRTIIILIPVVILAIALLLRTYQKMSTEDIKTKPITKASKKAPYKIINPKLKKDKEVLVYYENIEPFVSLKVYSKEQGFVKQIYVDIASPVRKDSVLAALDDSDLVEEEQEHRAKLATAKSSLRQNILETRHKKIIHSRARRAYNENIMPIQDLDNAKYDYEASLAKERVSSARIKEAEYALNKVISKINHMQVRSPISGIVSKRLVEKGTLIKANELLFEVLNLDKLKITLHVPERDISKIFSKDFGIKANAKFDLFIPSLNKSINAKINFMHPVVDKVTKTINLELIIINKDKIKPGLECKIAIENKSRSRLFLPSQAAFYDEINKQYFVRVIRENKVYRQRIEADKTNNAKELIVKEGLDKDSKVIMPFISNIKDGTTKDTIIQKAKG